MFGKWNHQGPPWRKRRRTLLQRILMRLERRK